MKIVCHIFILFCICLKVQSQPFYFRGEIVDDSGNPVQNVSIRHHSTGYIYNSGISGAFGFTGAYKNDTLTFNKDGYSRRTLIVDSEQFIQVRLSKTVGSAISLRRYKLASVTQDMSRENQQNWLAGDETYASLVENRFVNAAIYPSTGMALNIDRASYSNIRRFLNLNNRVPPDAVRIEEMLNYFNTGYNEPPPGSVFNIQSTLTSTPWNKENQLYFINVSSKKLNVDTLPPSHLVFLIDISGSMDMPNRLPLLQSAFSLLVQNLREKDSVSIVVYGGSVGIHLPTTGGGEKEKIIKAINDLTPGGSTPGESGVRLAYSVAKNHFIKDGNNRVILATDGDFNVGLKTEEELESLIIKQSMDGIYLTCLGVGMGNYKDSKIQTLARKGNGNFAYLDNFQEAEKVLLKEFTQTMYAVADDVYLNVKFNPVFVKQYRLIGFDNKVGALTDSLAAIEGGEIGSANNTMVVFELAPTPFYENEKEKSLPGQHLATVEMIYKIPRDTTVYQFTTASPYDLIPFENTDKRIQFSTAVALFGSLLRESAFIKSSSWNEVYSLAAAAHNPDDKPQAEFLTLVQAAKNIYSKKSRRKKRSKN